MHLAGGLSTKSEQLFLKLLEDKKVKSITGTLDHHVYLVSSQIVQWISRPIIGLQLGYLKIWRYWFFHNPLRKGWSSIVAEGVSMASIVSLELGKSLIKLLQLPFIVIKSTGLLIPSSFQWDKVFSRLLRRSRMFLSTPTFLLSSTSFALWT